MKLVAQHLRNPILVLAAARREERRPVEVEVEEEAVVEVSSPSSPSSPSTRLLSTSLC